MLILCDPIKRRTLHSKCIGIIFASRFKVSLFLGMHIMLFLTMLCVDLLQFLSSMPIIKIRTFNAHLNPVLYGWSLAHLTNAFLIFSDFSNLLVVHAFPFKRVLMCHSLSQRIIIFDLSFLISRCISEIHNRTSLKAFVTRA